METVADGSGTMFDRIAQRYDLLNALMSFGLDRGWRRRLVQELGSVGSGEVLDLATGTADVAVTIARTHAGCRVVGVDPSEQMLEVGREKVRDHGLSGRIELVRGRAEKLPFDDDRFAASCIAFGIRNVPERSRGLAELARVTRPGGRVVILELGEPDVGRLAPLARLHVRHVVPRLGRILSGAAEYRYLQQSIAAFPPRARFETELREASLSPLKTIPFAWGGANLFVTRV